MNTDDEIEEAYLAGFKDGTMDFADVSKDVLNLPVKYEYDQVDIATAKEALERWLSKTKT